MTYPVEVTDLDIYHHIANSVESYVDGDASLSFGSPWVDGDELRITVYDVNDEQKSKTWILKVESSFTHGP